MVTNVALWRLGRISYHKALRLQHQLFDGVKHMANIDQSRPTDRTCSTILPDLAATKESTPVHNKNIDGTIRYELKPSTLLHSLEYGERSSFMAVPDVSGHLLLVEHDPVYTIGIRVKDYNENYEHRLRQRLQDCGVSADFVKTNRGGLVTFHGPGQLVAYPIIYMKHFRAIENASLKKYVSLLENVIIDTLKALNLNGTSTIREHPGVWIDNERKIAAVGIHCNRYVTMHGVSINCNCDLSWFDHIVSCGIEGKTVTSLGRELDDKSITISRVIPIFQESFEKYFQCNLIEHLNLH